MHKVALVHTVWTMSVAKRAASVLLVHQQATRGW